MDNILLPDVLGRLIDITRVDFLLPDLAVVVYVNVEGVAFIAELPE